MTEQNGERLQKALSRAGIASRRGGEELIMAGRVKVNGKIVTELGTKIDPAVDKVSVDDEPISVRVDATPQKIYIMLNKPAGYLSTVSDPQGRPTIMDLLDTERYGRLYPVGRLDADTEGLLILTNDGAFANALSHPRFGVEKEYVALVDGIIAMKDIERLRRGVSIPVEDADTGEQIDHLTKPAKVDLIRHEGSNSLVRFVLKEGKKRQIRLMADAVDHGIIELRRVRQGPVKLSDLASGKYRNLSKQEVKDLQEASKPGATQEEAPAPVRGPAPAASATRRGPAPTGRSSYGSRDSGPSTGRSGYGSRDAGPGAGRSSYGSRDGGPGAGRSGYPARDNSQDTIRSNFAPRDGGRGRPERPERPERPAARVEPFKAPGTRSGPPRFGERRFGSEGSGFGGDRRGPAPSRGPRPGPARFEREEGDRPSRGSRVSPNRFDENEGGGDRNSLSRPVPPRFQRDGGRGSAPDSFAPGRGPRPGAPRFDREDSGPSRGPRPGAPRFDREDRGPRSGPPRFERDGNSAPPRREFGGSSRPDGRTDRGNDSRPYGRPERNFGGSDSRPDRRPDSRPERPAGPPRSARPERDGDGEERRPFRAGGNRPGGGGFGRDRDNDAPSSPRGGQGGPRKFTPSGGSGSPSFPSKYSRPNPNGFVPAAERSAPSPGRGRPPRSSQSGPDAGERGSRPGGGPRGNSGGPRTGGFRPGGPGRPRRED